MSKKADKKPNKVKSGEVLPKSNQTAEIPKQELHRLIAIAEGYEGPLPKASEFAEYEKVHRGAAHRIIRMAERALGAEIFAIRADKISKFVAMLLSRLFLYALLLAAVYLVIQNKPVEAAFAGLAPIVSVIYSTFKKPEEKKETKKSNTQAD